MTDYSLAVASTAGNIYTGLSTGTKPTLGENGCHAGDIAIESDTGNKYEFDGAATWRKFAGPDPSGNSAVNTIIGGVAAGAGIGGFSGTVTYATAAAAVDGTDPSTALQVFYDNNGIDYLKVLKRQAIASDKYVVCAYSYTENDLATVVGYLNAATAELLSPTGAELTNVLLIGGIASTANADAAPMGVAEWVGNSVNKIKTWAYQSTDATGYTVLQVIGRV